jgi:acetyltransferase-like isoleucine patch superfamily enzyme
MMQRETDAAARGTIGQSAPLAATAAAATQRDEGIEAEAALADRSRLSHSARGHSRLRLAGLGFIALLPSFLKRFCYRLFFGYRIGKRVRIGLTILDAGECEIADDVRIGHLNLVIGVKKIWIGDHVRIGHLNILRGGDEIRIGRYAEIIRLNEINSIPDPDVVNPVNPSFLLGEGSIITAGHKIDFTDRVEIGRRTILGGRNSSLWTHNRQRTRPIEIGSLTYIGSEIRIAPGGAIPSRCIVGIGAVITKQLKEENYLIGGVPAKEIKPLGSEDIFLIEQKTRPDLPDDI